MDFRAQLDQLKNIAEQELDERVTYRTLAKLSGIENPDKIYPGQKVTLPGGGSYTVKKGDTLSHIAQAYRLGKIGKKEEPKYHNIAMPKKAQDDFMSPDDMMAMGPDGAYQKKAQGMDPLNLAGPKDDMKSPDDMMAMGPEPEPKPEPKPEPTPVDQKDQITSKYNAIARTAGQTAADTYAKNVKLDPRATQDTKDALPKYNKIDIPKKAQGMDPLGLAGPKGKTWGEPGHGFTVPSGTSTTTKGNTVGMSEPTTQQRAQSLYQQIKGMIDAKPSTSGQMKRVNTPGDKK